MPLISLLIFCKKPVHLVQLHGQVIRKGLEQDHFVVAKILSLSWSLAHSSFVFNSVAFPSTLLYNIFLDKHVKKSATLNDTISLFIRMKHASHVYPDMYTYCSLVKMCSRHFRLLEGKIVHGSAIRSGNSGGIYVGYNLIGFYTRFNQMTYACKVFEEMNECAEVCIGGLDSEKPLYDGEECDVVECDD